MKTSALNDLIDIGYQQNLKVEFLMEAREELEALTNRIAELENKNAKTERGAKPHEPIQL